MSAVRELALLPETWTIQRATFENADTFTLELSRASRTVFDFEPGQFNMLYVPGFGEVAISISGAANRREPSVIHTIRAVGPATIALSKLRPGAEIGLRGPFGAPWPTQETLRSHAVVVAGGIGLAPLRPVIYALAAAADTRALDQLSTTIVYGARSPADQIFATELREWAKLPLFSVLATVDHADRSWGGPVGLVTQLLRSPVAEPARTLALSCGPEAMMRFTAMKLEELGMTRDRIYVSAERNMKCAVGVCGHCQFGPHFICKDGPVYPYHRIEPLMRIREL